MDERGFFDKLAPEWDNNEVLSTPDKINEILNFIDIRKGDSVLDLGTGTGVLLPSIAERVGKEGRITAVDYSQGMLNRAIEKFSSLEPKPEFLNLDFETENLEGEFNHIILYCVYPHLHTPVETLKWLIKVNLKDGGDITIAFPCGPDYINNIHKEKHSESDILPSATGLAKYLKDNGLNATVLADSDQTYVVKITK